MSSSLPADALVDVAELNDLLVEELSDAFLSNYSEPKRTAAGTDFTIDSIVLEAAKSRPPEPWNPNSVLLPSAKAAQKKLIKKAGAGVKVYKAHASNFGSMLYQYSQNEVKDLSHEQAKLLIEASGVDNRAAVHLGSAFDALISAVPTAAVKSLGGYAADELKDAVAELSEFGVDVAQAVENASRAGKGAAKSAVRIANTSLLKPLGLGFFGRSIPPDAKDMVIKPEQIQRINEEIAKLKNRPETLVGIPSPLNERELHAALLKELEALQSARAEFDDALGLRHEQKIMLATTFATVGVKIAARLAAEVALTPYGLSELARLISMAIDPSMAAATKGVSNRQQTYKIARVALHQYKQGQLTEGLTQTEKLEAVSHSVQDHFQGSDEANYHRNLNTVLHVRLDEQACEIEKDHRRIGELQMLCDAKNAAATKVVHKVFTIQDEIGSVNSGFKTNMKSRNPFARPLEYLKVDTEIVESLLGMASGSPAVSNPEFAAAITTHAGALLTVHASSSAESTDLMHRFKKAYLLRTGESLSDELLFEKYEETRFRMADWLARNIHPLHGSDRKIAKAGTPGQEQNKKRLAYLTSNLEIVIERAKKEGELRSALSDLNLLNSKAYGLLDKPNVAYTKASAKYRVELEALQKKHSTDIRKYQQYKLDLDNFANNRADLVDPKGKLARLVLAHDRDIPHQLGQGVQHRVLKDFRKRTGVELGMVLGGSLVGGGVLSAVSDYLSTGDSEDFSANVSSNGMKKTSASTSSLRAKYRFGISGQALQNEDSVGTLSEIFSDSTVGLQRGPAAGKIYVNAFNEPKSSEAELVKLVGQFQKNLDWKLRGEQEISEAIDELEAGRRVDVLQISVDRRQKLKLDKSSEVIRLQDELAEAHASWMNLGHDFPKALPDQDLRIEKIQRALHDAQDELKSVEHHLLELQNVMTKISTFGNGTKAIDWSTLNSILDDLKQLDIEDHQTALAWLVSKVDGLSEPDATLMFNAIWKSVEEIPSPDKRDIYGDSFAFRTRLQQSTTFDRLLTYSNSVGYGSRSTVLKRIASSISRLHVDDRWDRAQAVLSAIQRLDKEQRVEPLLELASLITSLNNTDRLSLFDKLWIETTQLESDNAGRCLVALANEFLRLPIADLEQRFETLLDSKALATSNPAEKMEVADRLLQAVERLKPSARFRAMKGIISLANDLPSQLPVPLLGKALRQLHLFSSDEAAQVFEEMSGLMQRLKPLDEALFLVDSLRELPETLIVQAFRKAMVVTHAIDLNDRASAVLELARALIHLPKEEMRQEADALFLCVRQFLALEEMPDALLEAVDLIRKAMSN